MAACVSIARMSCKNTARTLNLEVVVKSAEEHNVYKLVAHAPLLGVYTHKSGAESAVLLACPKFSFSKLHLPTGTCVLRVACTGSITAGSRSDLRYRDFNLLTKLK